jgi:hypothetical protein
MSLDIWGHRRRVVVRVDADVDERALSRVLAALEAR